MDTNSLLSWSVRLNIVRILQRVSHKIFCFLCSKKASKHKTLFYVTFLHLISGGEAKLNYTSLLINSCHDRGVPSHRQRLMAAYMILVTLSFSISQSNYIFINICMNLDIWSKSWTLFISFHSFYETSLLYGKSIATFKFKHKCLTFVPIVQV